MMLFFGAYFHGILLSFHSSLHNKESIIPLKYAQKNSMIDRPRCISYNELFFGDVK